MYLKILGVILPLFRNIHQQHWWHRIKAPSFFLDAELVHNLPECLVHAEFTKADIWWMNTQARLFVENGDESKCAFYGEFVKLITELFSLVPDNLQGELSWSGPNSEHRPSHGDQRKKLKVFWLVLI